MAVAGGDGVEKLEDMIVRAAETTAAHVAAAKAAIGAVIFGQEQRGRAHADHPALPAATRCWSACPASPRPSWSRRWAPCSASTPRRIQFTPDLMPSDILGSEVLEEGARRQAQLPLHPRPGLRASC